MNKRILILPVYLTVIILAGCSDATNLTENERNAPSQASIEEQAVVDEFNSQSIGITGKIHDEAGLPVANAVVSVVDSTLITTTTVDGSFSLGGLSRRNLLIEITSAGHRSEYIPVYMQYQLATNTIAIPTIVLSNNSTTRARMLFGGDTAFARRFLDVDESTPVNQVPPDDPAALIQASDPETGTRNVLAELRPYYQEADLGVLNFETPVTDSPVTPHPEKDFVFFTLPGSLPALNWLGIDYVSLGNNHVYDYLQAGTVDTINHLNNAGIAFTGAGLDSTQAFTAHRQTVKNTDYSFLAMTSIDGSQYSINYVADASKGGAANLKIDADVTAAVQAEIAASRIPIVQYHMGDEYIYEPTSYVLNRIQLAVNENLPLVVLHHPHVAQGVGLFGNTHAVLGLGNLAFDQSRLETMLGVMARVDMDASTVESIRMLPVYLENYAPKLISGRLAHDFLRRLGEFSHAYNGLLYPYNGQGWVSLTPTDRVAQDRSVTIDISIPASGSVVVDLREYLQWGESLYSFTSSRPVDAQIGRDLMQHGDFEDWDKDEDFNEVSRWDQIGDDRFVCLSHAYRDATGLCTVRKSVNSDDVVVAFRNRIRVMGDAHDTPNKDLSLFGYYKASNAGLISIVSRYYASFGELEFGEEIALSNAGGSFDWQPFVSDLNMPADVPVIGEPGELNARALRIFIHQSPPLSGEGLVAFDELAIVGWEDNIVASQLLDVPHAKDFIKITAGAGNLQLTLQIRKYVPAASQ